MKTIRTFGILAGNGQYPVLLAERFRSLGISTAIAALRGQTTRSLFPPGSPFLDVPLGAFERAANFFRAHDATNIVFAGGVERRGALLYMRPDRFGIRMIGRALFRGDDRLLRTAARCFHDLGIEVTDPSPHIREWFGNTGLLAGPPLSSVQNKNLSVARRAAILWGARDRGQAAIARCGRVLGRETVLGTDALIAWRGRPDSVLVKMVKPGQDRRFDLPAVGERTILRAHSKGIVAIGVEAGGVLLLDKARVFEACNLSGISLVGLSPGSPRRSES